MRVPPGCGRPVWVDDPTFCIHRHVEYLICPSPGDERALLEVAAELVMYPPSAILGTVLNVSRMS